MTAAITTPSPYGDPDEWDGEMPIELVVAICEHLGRLGWSVLNAHSSGVQIELTEQAAGWPSERARGDEWWIGFGGGAFIYGAINADKPHDGIQWPQDLLADPVDPEAVAQRTDQALRTRSAS